MVKKRKMMCGTRDELQEYYENLVKTGKIRWVLDNDFDKQVGKDAKFGAIFYMELDAIIPQALNLDGEEIYPEQGPAVAMVINLEGFMIRDKSYEQN